MVESKGLQRHRSPEKVSTEPEATQRVSGGRGSRALIPRPRGPPPALCRLPVTYLRHHACWKTVCFRRGAPGPMLPAPRQSSAQPPGCKDGGSPKACPPPVPPLCHSAADVVSRVADGPVSLVANSSPSRAQRWGGRADACVRAGTGAFQLLPGSRLSSLTPARDPHFTDEHTEAWAQGGPQGGSSRARGSPASV